MTTMSISPVRVEGMTDTYPPFKLDLGGNVRPD